MNGTEKSKEIKSKDWDNIVVNAVSWACGHATHTGQEISRWKQSLKRVEDGMSHTDQEIRNSIVIKQLKTEEKNVKQYDDNDNHHCHYDNNNDTNNNDINNNNGHYNINEIRKMYSIV